MDLTAIERSTTILLAIRTHARERTYQNELALITAHSTSVKLIPDHIVQRPAAST